MSDRFLSALKSIERKTMEEFSFEDTTSSRLFELTHSMCHETISDNDYLKLLELHYQMYAKEVDRSNMLYCLLRMQQIQEAKKYKFRRRKFNDVEFQIKEEISVSKFLKGKKPYLSQMRHRGLLPLMTIDTVVYIGLLCLFVFGLHFPFVWSMITAFIIWILFLVYGYLVIVEIMVSDQLKNMLKKANPALIEFEKKRACDSFKLFHKYQKKC